MKKSLFIIGVALALLIVCAGCAREKNGDTATMPDPSQNAPDTSAVPDTEKEYDYDEILNGNLSDFEGIWINEENAEITLKADGTAGEEYTENDITYKEKAGGFEKQEDGCYTWGVSLEDYDGPSSYDMWLFPVGVDVFVYGQIVETDTTVVRLYAGHDFYPANEMSVKIYYLK